MYNGGRSIYVARLISGENDADSNDFGMAQIFLFESSP
jgi:hypothetical protein